MLGSQTSVCNSVQRLRHKWNDFCPTISTRSTVEFVLLGLCIVEVEVEKQEAGLAYPSFVLSRDAEVPGIFSSRESMVLDIPQT